MSQRLLSALVAIALVCAPVAHAQEENPKEMFEDATRLILQALELMIKAIPQYEAPVVLENGDILIRRKPKDGDEPEMPAHPEPGPDQDRI